VSRKAASDLAADLLMVHAGGWSGCSSARAAMPGLGIRIVGRPRQLPHIVAEGNRETERIMERSAYGRTGIPTPSVRA